jgi:Phosphodiester glycosidase/SPOR domain
MPVIGRLRKVGWFVALVMLGGALTGAPGGAKSTTETADELPLGPADLEETRTSTTIAPGLVHTSIRRGHRSADDFFTVDVTFFAARAPAARTARRLRNMGYRARVERISARAPDDPRRGPTGYLVRVGRLSSQARADAVAARLIADGFPDAAGTYTGFDGRRTTGPWVVNIFDVDLDRFRGELTPELGTHVVPGLEKLERIARRTGALAAINGGYFVIEPVDGTSGDLAGISVRNGKLLSEAVDGRTSLLVHRRPADGAAIRSLHTGLRATASDGTARLVDGLNRKPGLIRACGGDGRDEPVQRPKHDFTCTDDSELIRFTRNFGKSTPSGPGAEAAMNARGRVTVVRNQRGGSIPAGGSVLSATGDRARWLRRHAEVGRRISVRTRVFSPLGKVSLSDDLGVINGGPRLVRKGRTDITAFEEGFVHKDDPFFYVAFGIRRNPRTIAGITRDRHLLLVAIDGRQPDWSVGATFIEEARVMRSLGVVGSVNLDGGGSTTMTIGDELTNRPSDEEGPRPIGDALLLRP